MRASEPVGPAALPRAPVAQLVGHDGPVQAVVFTGELFMFPLLVSTLLQAIESRLVCTCYLPYEEKYFSRLD